MLAHAVIVRDPFHPGTSREVQELTEPGQISALAIPGDAPFVILRNGAAVLRADWEQEIMDGDMFAVVVLPQDGGGGGSNPLTTILRLAVVVVATVYGGPLGGVAGSWGQVATSAAIMVAGNMLINVLIPPPTLPSAQQQSQMAAASPTYSLQAQGNTARLDSAIPEHFGRLRVFPDFAAMPYVEYAGNEQYLYSLLCIGRGSYSVEAVQIEDSPVSSFAEITYEIIAPGGALTMFPANVATSGEVSGQELLQGAYIGPFAANAAGTQANFLGFDVVLPRGLYHVNAETGALETVSLTVQCECRPIDDNGTPTGDGSYTVLGTTTYSYATTTPQRASIRYAVTAARYQCRMTRTDTKQTDTTYGHEVVWAGLRAYLPETRNFGDVTLLAMRMRASNNLSTQSSRKVNVIATRKLPIWNGSEWSALTATSSIAWAFAYVCKVAVPDSRIDLAGLLALDAVWAARRDTFDGRFDNAVSLWEALTKIAVAGRAKPFMQGGIIRLSRDASQSIPVALFSMRNILRGSFSVHYLMPTEETADAVEVAYFDRNYWASRRVLSKLAGSAAAKPVKVDLFGVTDRNQAFREGVYQAACNRYRRKIIKFQTEMEGFIPSFGDLIAISHDMPQWGQFAEVLGYDPDTLLLTVSEPLVFTTGTHYVGLRKRDGSISGPYAVTAGNNEYQLALPSLLDFTPYTGMNEERTHVVFGPGETWRQPAKVVGVRPRGLYSVEIECINEDASVHTAEDGLTAPPVNYSQLPTNYTAPVITSLNLKSSTSDVSKVLAVWTPAPGADTYQIEMASGTDPNAAGLVWTRVAETTANNWAVTALYGSQTLIRVRGVGLVAGPWSALFYGSVSDYMWVNDAANMWNATDTTLMWK